MHDDAERLADPAPCGAAGCPSPAGLCAAGRQYYRRRVETGSAGGTPVPRCLSELGLLEPDPGRPGQFTQVTPVVALDRLLRPLEQESSALRGRAMEVQAAFETVEEIFTDARRSRLPHLTVLRGRRTIAETIDAAAESCQEELLTAQPGNKRPQEILDEVLDQNLSLLRRGVRQRTLYQHAVRSDQPTFRYISEVVSAGGDVRTLDEMFDRLVICDRSVAYIPTGPAYAEEALEVRHPAIVRFLVNVFEFAFSRGIPVTTESQRRPSSVVSDTEKTIMRLLVEGQTEIAIARKMSISRRTVAEYVSRISQRLGSNSRTQLGYLMAVNGLIKDA
ncbi:hypothetical protein KIH74_25635 [Kineosporia sp. J2-2]|uniref:HTH luxR-type domain-containing protein n=1 Tax=Kineosporia corallincola TaxID=2835133 RepID=A0ABS5TMN4_9ACTN|nr:LuxR C-terminal-related transcriptional regulator [Kineosporia corallincola]MBT0772352.1 hypothetical protein [Kineosporia corallincola]